jgi:hypothetical protein
LNKNGDLGLCRKCWDEEVVAMEVEKPSTCRRRLRLFKINQLLYPYKYPYKYPHTSMNRQSPARVLGSGVH